VEVDVILEWTGTTMVRLSFLHLMQQLGRPSLRVGGDSTDYSIWNPLHLPLPPWKTRPARYNITQIDVHALKQAVASYNGTLVFGVNFREPNNASYAVEHMKAIDAIIGLNSSLIRAIEIGVSPPASHRHFSFVSHETLC